MKPISNDLAVKAQALQHDGHWEESAAIWETLAQKKTSFSGNAAWAFLVCGNLKKSKLFFDQCGGAPRELKALFQWSEKNPHAKPFDSIESINFLKDALKKLGDIEEIQQELAAIETIILKKDII